MAKSILSDKTIGLLKFRIQKEEESSRLYKSMSNWLLYNGFIGASALYDKYAKEEYIHAEKAINYLSDLDIKPELSQLEQPQTDFKSLPDILQLSYQHELDITKQVSELAKASMEEGDMLTFGIAQWYVNEQVEEINKTTMLLDKLEAFGTDKIALRLLDNEIGELAG